jgi:hypothetical protein
VIAAVLGGAIGGGVGYASQGAKIVALTKELGLTKDQLKRAEDSLAKAAEKPAPLAVTPTDSAPSTPATATAPKPAAGESGRQFGFITKVEKSGGTTYVTIDYAQFLTGKAAADAAAAHGDESPPPNDYYILNESKKLRRFGVKAGIKVKIVNNADGGSDPSGHLVSLQSFSDSFNGVGGGNLESALNGSPYFVVLKSGTITAIEQVYLP